MIEKETPFSGKVGEALILQLRFSPLPLQSCNLKGSVSTQCVGIILYYLVQLA